MEFTKRDNNAYCWFISKKCILEIRKKSNSSHFHISETDFEGILPGEVSITKEEFIEANKCLLQKTGLINLFEDTETTLKVELTRLQDVITKQEKSIQHLTNNKNYYQQQVNSLSEWKEKAEQYERVLEKSQNKIHQLGIELECQTENKRIISKMESMLIEKDKEQFRIRLELEGKIKSLESTLKYYL
jgi:predicted PilT family ATPase